MILNFTFIETDQSIDFSMSESDTLIDFSFIDTDELIDFEFSSIVEFVKGEYYDGEYSVRPLADSERVLPTTGKVMHDNVTVQKVPYYTTTNASNGYTVFIAEEV